MRGLLIFLIFLFGIKAYSGEKHALIIAIGNYPSSTGWKSVSSVNDVPLITDALLKQGFNEKNITTLIDREATKKGILSALDDLKNRVNKGDIVVIHYSGHGQQIFDSEEDGGLDEADGLDEALVPYDALASYKFNYEGENHIRDDLLGDIVAEFRNKLGADGQILIVLDSCHSGSATRGTGSYRGTTNPFIPDDWEAPTYLGKTRESLIERVPLKENAAPFILITGASAGELNYEYIKGKNKFGSLSYAFSQAMNDLETDFTYRQLFAEISAIMNVIAPDQRPTIEGDMDYKLFKGDYVIQQPYFEVIQVTNFKDKIHINAGEIQRIFEDTSVFVLPKGSLEVESSKVLAKGNVIISKALSSVIELNKPLPDTIEKNYWVFIDQPSYGDIAVNVFFAESAQDKTLINEIDAFLQKNNLGKVVEEINESDLVVEKINEEYVLGNTRGSDEFEGIASMRGNPLSDELKSKIFNYAQGNYLKALSFNNRNFEFSFRLLPIDYDEDTGKLGELKPEGTNLNESGILQVVPDRDYAVLEIENKGNKTIYISIVEINSEGEISPFFPNDDCTLTDDDRKLAPGQKVIFRDNCYYEFGPPYERLMLKGFASDQPLDFKPTVSTRGERKKHINNPLEDFLQDTYSNTRGPASKRAKGNIKAYSAEFIYDIVDKK